MNKIIKALFYCFLIAFILGLVSCSQTQKETNTQTPVDYYSLTFAEYDQYVEFMNNIGKSEKVISYESLASFGEFKALIFLCFTEAGDYSRCLYEFDDPVAGREISLYVTDLSKSEGYKLYNGEFENNEICSDLRTVGGDVSGYQTVGEAKYAYVHGQLLSIHWVCRDIGFVLSIESDKDNDYALFDSYPSDADTLIARLLDRETATDALNALCERIVRENPAAFGE